MNQPIPPKLGKYEVIAPLGSGAQATVYRARQPGLEREVAIKVVALGSATASDFLARFEQEAQVAARLEHPNILPVHDYGEQDGFAYFVMRLVRNGTLAQRMASGPGARRRSAGHSRANRTGARPRPRASGDPPRRKTGQHPAQRGRPGPARRLRHLQAARGLVAPVADGFGALHSGLLQPGPARRRGLPTAGPTSIRWP
jgi:hypothetical protein